MKNRTIERSNYAIKGIPRCINHSRPYGYITYRKEYCISSCKGKYYSRAPYRAMLQDT